MAAPAALSAFAVSSPASCRPRDVSFLSLATFSTRKKCRGSASQRSRLSGVGSTLRASASTSPHGRGSPSPRSAPASGNSSSDMACDMTSASWAATASMPVHLWMLARRAAGLRRAGDVGICRVPRVPWCVLGRAVPSRDTGLTRVVSTGAARSRGVPRGLSHQARGLLPSRIPTPRFFIFFFPRTFAPACWFIRSLLPQAEEAATRAHGAGRRLGGTFSALDRPDRRRRAASLGLLPAHLARAPDGGSSRV